METDDRQIDWIDEMQDDQQLTEDREAMRLTHQYGPLMDMMEIIDKRNQAIIEGNEEDYREYTKMLEGL